MKRISKHFNYAVTSDGRVWSVKHKKYLKQHLSHNGYLFVRLWNKTKHCYKNYRVSRLVLETFVEPCPKGMECCHNDGTRTNNNLYNLRWDTHKNNIAEGNSAVGSAHGRAKLNEQDVKIIRKLVLTKLTLKEIGKIFNVTEQMVWYIKKRKNWKHI